MIGGAWPFLVRGVICLLNCVSLKASLIFCALCLTPLSFTGLSACLSHTITLTSESNERDRNLLLPSLPDLHREGMLSVSSETLSTRRLFFGKLEGPLLLSLNQRKVAAITGL